MVMVMEHVSIREARQYLDQLIDKVLQGNEVIISRAGYPVAKLVPVSMNKSRRKLGLMKGKIWIADDFEAPLPKALIDEFE